MIRWRFSLLLLAAVAVVPPAARAQSAAMTECLHPAPGSTIPEPKDLRSRNGVLRVELTYRNFRDGLGQTHYCYQDQNGDQSPNLRVHPGDLLILTLKNHLRNLPGSPHVRGETMNMPGISPCGGGIMDGLSTNLHFHGLSVPPLCHQDDVLNTLISPTGSPFEYRFRIPPDEPPGVYWYHPHVHGFTAAQVLGGASGALIVEGIEQANSLVAGLPERVLVVRDQELRNPNAAPLKSNVNAPVFRDAEGDVLNSGTGEGKPAKDLSINFVPVPFPDYPPAVTAIKPGERQLWRILNASAVTYLDLQILVNGSMLPMGVVSLDGVPVDADGVEKNRIALMSHYLLPPAGRMDFVFKGPPGGARASLVTRSVDTGPAGENDPVRPLATILSIADAPEPGSILPAAPAPSPFVAEASTWLGNAKPVRERKLYFSERPSDPSNPNSPTVFMLTVDGQEPAPYDPHSKVPNIIVRQGDVEDWIIENRSQELHAFHIHQIHFLLKEWLGFPIDEPFLRDTINVPYWDGKSPTYPSVKLRMDFRSPRIAGTFVYHCHILDHEDGGMMGTIRVEARERTTRQGSRYGKPGTSATALLAKSSNPTSPGRPVMCGVHLQHLQHFQVKSRGTTRTQ